MKNGLKYVIEWNSAKNSHIVTVNIWDTNVQIDDADDPEVRTLRASGRPTVTENVDNDRDKLNPVVGTRAVIQFLSDENYDVTTFAQGPDNRWYTEVILTDNGNTEHYIHRGYLSLSDMSQDFLPNPNIVTLVSSDHLGLLNDIPFTDDDGEKVKGYNRIIYYLATALKKTGLALNINVQNNLRAGSGQINNAATFSGAGQYFVTDGLLTDFFYVGQTLQITGTTSNNGTFQVTSVDNSSVITQVEINTTITGESALGAVFTDVNSGEHFYEACFLNAKTFEKTVSEGVSCREVIEYILGEDCQLSQYRGEWYIQRLDEQDGNIFYHTIFDSDGVYVTGDVTQQYDMNIGDGEDAVWADASCLLECEGPRGTVRETYEFNTPEEVPDNVDFEHGDLSSTISDTEKRYELDDWYLREGYPGGYGTVDDTTVYMTRTFNENGYEDERYITLTPRGTAVESAATWTYLESNAIPVHENDKFNASIDWRLPSDIATGGNNYWLMQCVLFGDDGSYWILGNQDIAPDTYNQTDYKWWDTSVFTANTGAGQQPIDFDLIDESEWTTLSWNAPPVPVDGRIFLWLHQFNQDASVSTDNVNIHYTNLRFEYIPYINGNYVKYNSQYHQNKRSDTDYAARREATVMISDSPKKLFKGAIFIPTIGNEFYDGSIQFGTNGFVLSGDLTATYRPGEWIYIDSASYTGHYKIISAEYSIIGGTTAVTVDGTISAVTENGVIHETIFILINRFWTAHSFALDYPDDMDDVKPYGKQQVDAVWNQYRNPVKRFSGYIYGIPEEWPSLNHKYRLTDTNPSTNNRNFQCLSLEIDWNSEIWRGDFIEVYNSVTGKVYDDDHEFKYETN